MSQAANASSPASSGIDIRNTIETSLSVLIPGTPLRMAVYDNSGLLLIASGTRLTGEMLQRLALRGIQTVRIHRSELERLTAQQAPEAAVAESSLDQRPFLTPRIAAPVTIWSPEVTREISEQRSEAMGRVNHLYRNLQKVDSGHLGAFQNLTRSTLHQMILDIDVFVSHGLVPPGTGEYPANHGVNFTVVAMSIGANLGLTIDDLKLLGVGCLVHDLGMMRLNRKVLQRSGPTGIEAQLELTKHPVITYNMLRDVEWMIRTSRVVAYEVHERMDGSGYPRRRRGNQIHYLSRIAGVAECYSALIAKRPGRVPMSPYQSIKEILLRTQQGLFDPEIVKALLRTVSLFPIGSYVELSDGRQGRVLRSNGPEYTKPLIEAWPAAAPEEIELINLLEQTELSVQKTFPGAPQPPEDSEQEQAAREADEETSPADQDSSAPELDAEPAD